MQVFARAIVWQKLVFLRLKLEFRYIFRRRAKDLKFYWLFVP